MQIIHNIRSIGIINNCRSEAEDDNWNLITSTVSLYETVLSKEATCGLETFSHIEIIFYMHKVQPEKINTNARHPRNNKSWPKVGILAQRGKNRVNQIGVSRCKLMRVDGLKLTVLGLDAIDGTPVLDVKPWMKGFFPQGETFEPSWANEIMKNYY